MNTDTAVKHTPGPWEAVFDDIGTGQRHWRIIDDSPVRQRICESPVGPQAFNEANATLIASAPTLLAALKAVTATYRTFRNVPRDEQEWTPLDDEALDAAFAAIRQAEGA